MLRQLVAAALILVAVPAGAHEIRVTPQAAAADPYAPYAFLIGDWALGNGKGGPAFATVKFHWAANHAYITYGAYLGEHPHFEGMLMWNGVHRNLDALIATDMERGQAQELGTVRIENGTLIRDSTASYSAGVGSGGPVAGPAGATNRTRQTIKAIDADHIATTFEIETPQGWKPAMPGGDDLLMTRVR